MKTHPNELILYLDCSSIQHRKTRAFAQTITDHINELHFKDHKFTTTMWKDILEMLKMHPKELLNKSDPDYQKLISGKNFDEDGWLEILVNNPCLIKAPIAIMKNKAVLCIKPKDIYRLIPEHQDNL